MGRHIALLCMVAGCGRIGFDPLAVDAIARPCQQFSAFSSPPLHIAELGAPSTDDWGPAISADELSIYLYSQRPGSMGSFDIWTATRSSPADTWGTPTNVTELNTTFDERAPWISRDRLTIGFASDRPGGLGIGDLWWATRPDITSAFGAPALIPNVSSASDELASYLSANGLRLYMSSGRSGVSLDLFVAERATVADDFATPVAITELNSPLDERSIVVSNDELEVFFSSGRAGSQGDDIYRATRPDLATPFSTPVRVTELDTAMDDVNPNLSNDGTQMYFNYDAVTAGGDSEIWLATRTCVDL